MSTVGDLVCEVSERPQPGAEPPVLTLTERNGFVLQSDRFKKRLATEDTSRYKLVRKDDIAFNPYLLWAGAVARNTVVDEGITSPLYPTFRVRAGHDPRFVARLLLAPRTIASYDGIAFGSVPRRRRTSTADFLALEVSQAPGLDEQRRIAAILDAVDAIRSKRKAVLAHLDALTQALFHRTFGDPLSNSAGLETQRIGTVARVLTGNSPSRQDPDNFGGDIEWIKSGNLGPHIATMAKERLSESGRRKARIAPKGSVLVTCIAGSPASIGKASIADRDVAFNQQINAVLPSPKIRPDFLLAQIKISPSLVRQKSTGGMKGLVNKSAFEDIEILIPSLESQDMFVERVKVIDSMRAAVQRALALDDELFASLQSRAFSGKL